MSYSLSDFDYELPEKLIAQEPASPRDHARLLVYDRSSKTITDDHFYNILDYLPAETTLVANNSKVEKCRLLFDGGTREIFVLETLNPETVRAMVRPGKKFREGGVVELADQISAEVLSIDEEGIRTLRLSPSLRDPIYETYKYTPFPPYIKQNEELSEEYQTVYARDLGSKAAPTAGLHFTDNLVQKIGDSDIGWAEVTLHVGLGTFAPVKTKDIDEHTMHSEWYEIDDATAQKLNRSSHLTAIGTTSIRVLESNSDRPRHFKPETKETDIFIRPGYQFNAVDSLITNFHLPKSTLLMLVAAFMGFEEMHRVYQHAIDEQYRFYSFGDAMLIL
ncbi:tRNA preQ1(34) S-adenosylmethionine ribosyltransferase-isomerase QueA [Aliifodinibius sp. S!AR15-10]|uniref:tRNA preQ1(34) S-adenosylmethionine ribosyltransferase-isomerase QueA n=1 Tax=Aliifodinibius sp. S!AR15-10 TaxID=2950437 RepID=UPI00286030FA|nr:tRNA preQ1(34) S-adenosylmethionine ribosyltransferase-isomerase QueA [Aliifodinibius sp. S!AR15-10]MDR8392968.1 tRNA preQ1(34) S-adenosylmethionine ribosyltransferase-isomerase QueA [Aliifodinibius sp. S!AR15-10]